MQVFLFDLGIHWGYTCVLKCDYVAGIEINEEKNRVSPYTLDTCDKSGDFNSLYKI